MTDNTKPEDNNDSKSRGFRKGKYYRSVIWKALKDLVPKRNGKPKKSNPSDSDDSSSSCYFTDFGVLPYFPNVPSIDFYNRYVSAYMSLSRKITIEASQKGSELEQLVYCFLPINDKFL